MEARRCSDRQPDGDGDDPHRRVTVAPTSRQYVMRKPMFSAEQTPILKKIIPQRLTEKVKQPDVSRPHTDRTVWTRPDQTSPLSGSAEDLGSSLAVSQLSGRFCSRGATFESTVSGSRLGQLSLEFQKLVPPLTSTLLRPTYPPHSARSRHSQARVSLGKRGAKIPPDGTHSKDEPMSQYEWNYWACALPKVSPLSPDRRSPDWDPNREYQALLDYTYPLRPGQRDGRWGSSGLQDNLQDSGIELEHLRSSTSLSGIDSVNGTGRIRERSSHLQRFSSSSSRGLDCRDGRDGQSLSSSMADFFRSTSILPQASHVNGELDEEFWPLPEQLDELRLLSAQVREMVAQLARPVSASWESLDPGSAFILSDKQEEEGVSGDAERRAQMAAGNTWAEPVGQGGAKWSGLREVETLAEQLHGLTLSCGQRNSQEDSLLHHIQVFCCQLQQLIQQLHMVSENTKLLAPTVSSVKASLAEYQSFQSETSGCLSLTSRVLHTGRLLLSCIDTTSPLLRDALLLIERRSHSEHQAWTS